MNSSAKIVNLSVIKNIGKAFCLLLILLVSFTGTRAQEFQFVPDIDNEIFNSYQNTGYNYTDPIYPSGAMANLWNPMLGNPGWPSLYKFKSVTNIIKVAVDHKVKTIHNNYRYLMVFDVKGYTLNAQNAVVTTNINDLQFVLEYDKDSLKAYKDVNSLKLKDASFFKIDVYLKQIYDISAQVANPAAAPVPISYAQAEKNFFIETSIITQRHDKQPFKVFVNSQLDQTNHELNVYWGYFDPVQGTPSCTLPFNPLSYKPVKYELEWIYVDDYKVNNFNNTAGSYGYKNTGSSFSIPYNFKNNSTRIQTYENSFKIPVIYEHGSIVFRIRTIRPDSTNYSKLIYSPWNIANDAGTLTQSSFGGSASNPNFSDPLQCVSNCVCLIPGAFENDKFDWQYSINFAEEGKYKHVLNFFDGAGHNRQTLTKINTDDEYIIGADHIYDFEGRPSIQTLPVPLQSQNLNYKNSLSWKAGTTNPYSAIDFDRGCLADSIYGFDVNSYAGKYYSASNPDKAGMQQFVPDAEGYPFIETIYSPDNTNKVIWQGGAGLSFQRFKKHGTTNAYVRASQEELNRLFGTQAGRNEYYPKVITRDPNGQMSYSIFNQGGKVVATALAGSAPNSDSIPIIPLDSLTPATSVTSDILANLTQGTGDGLRSANYPFFPEAGGDNSWKYQGAISPYPTSCGGWFLNAQGFYRIKVVDDCGNIQKADGPAGPVAVGLTSIATTNTKQYFSPPAVDPFNLVPQKYTLIKELYFPDTTLVRLADTFTRANSGIGKCYAYEDTFIRISVNAASFPCKKDSFSSHCDELKRKMMDELYPGAKYGGYNQNPGGGFASGKTNSIFTQIDDNGEELNASVMYPGGGGPPPLPPCYYKRQCSYENGGGATNGNGNSLYLEETIIPWNPGDSMPTIGVDFQDGIKTCHYTGLFCTDYKFRYQWNCATLPTITWTEPSSNPGIPTLHVGPANGAPPDVLIQVFNDDIAEKLLVYHPEYCKLLLCDDHLEDILQKITDYKDAKALGLNTLDKILHQDLLCTYNPNGILTPVQLSKLLIVNQNPSTPNYLLQPLDKLSLEKAYCGCDGPEAYAYCRTTMYASQIQAMNVDAADTQVQNSFIRNLIAMYIGNRNLIRQQYMDHTSGNCPPCPEKRMTLTGDPVFTPVFEIPSGDFSSDLGFPPDVLDALNDAMDGVASNTPPDTALNMEAGQRFDSAQVLQIINKLTPNCAFPNGSITSNALFTQLLSNSGINGEKITPQIVKAAMQSLNIPIDNLCNPFLAAYGIYDLKQIKPAQKFVNKDLAFYADFNAFLNKADVENAMSNATTGGGSISTLAGLSTTSNKFEKELALTLNWTSGPVDLRGYKVSVPDPGYLPAVGTVGTSRNYIKLVITSGSNTETIYLTKLMQRICNSNTTFNIPLAGNPTSQFSFTDAHSVLNDDNTSGVADGLIADNLVFATLNGFNGSAAVCDNYIIWTEKTPMMGLKGAESMDDCINCVQIKQAIEGYFADATAYGMPTFADHPYFRADLTNYLNFKLKKKHGYYDYERLMQGCALSNKIAFPKSSGQYHLVFNTFSLSNPLSAESATANRLINGITVKNLSFSYLEGSNVHLWVDLNQLPEDSFRKADLFLGASQFYLPPPALSGQIMDVLIPVNGCGVTPVWNYLPAGASVSTPSTVSLKNLAGQYTQNYTKYSISGSSLTERQITDVIASVKGYFASPAAACPDVAFIDSRKVMRDSNYYSNPDKQAYLDYVFGLESSGQSLYDISNNIAPGVLQGTSGSGVAPFTGTTYISYKSPWCENVKEDLYYGANPNFNPGWDTLNKIITCVKVNTPLGLGTGKLFLAEADNIKTITSTTLGAGSSLKAIKMSNGWSWYRLFNNNSKLLNVYLIPPPNMLPPFSDYTIPTGTYPELIPGTGTLRRFKILMKKQTAGMTDPHYVTCYGYADFSLGTEKVLKNVVLADGNDDASCLDTFPCERNTLMTAILQGKAMYANYMDSIKNYHYAKMKTWFPENTVDTLNLSTWKQQYQYTLYNYDLAGNLISTVPPEGVVPMTTNFSGVDNARNTNNSSPSFYPPFLVQGNLNGGKKSEYYYNSFNQLVKQSIPDGGVTTFYYDNAGRLVFSQNAKQAPTSKFSYTLYDNQGRICETGAVSFPGTTISAVINSGINSPVTIASQVRARPREDVVATFYDEPLLTLNTYANEGLSAQENLRKRVSSILYIPQLAVNNSAESFYSYGTHFSYDALGNVKTLVQDNPYMNYLGQRFKRIDYDYDLLSGKVNMVSYNRGKADQFYQKYEYDADNRITDVRTSNDALVWDRDAHYDYYKHGPLAQVEIGDLKVQSLQYAYTIQGWLKAINGDVLDSTADMGQDGINGGLYPRDVVAHALDYHPGDYKPIGARQVENSDSAHVFYKGLYNGNIARQVTGIHSLANLQRTYTYDQLNRIKQTVYANVDNLSHAVTAMANANAYANSYQYDKAGNIKKLTRRDGSGNLIDDFTYNYYNLAENNRLGSVSDAAANTPGGSDLQSGQNPYNYLYDAIGNLTVDTQGNIQKIKWNLYGKVTDIDMNAGNKRVHYDYDATGNRIRKDVTVLDGGNGMRVSDLYVRDASGNILAVYQGQSKITGGLTIGWVNDHINNYHGGWHTVNGYGLAPFLATQFASDGQFTMPLLDLAQALGSEWCAQQSSSLSLAGYLSVSDGIFAEATHQDINLYFDHLRDYDEGNIIYHSFASDIGRNFMPVFATFLNNGQLPDTGGFGTTPPPAEVENNVTLNVFKHLFTDAPTITSLLVSELRLGWTGKPDDDANTFYSYIWNNGTGNFLDIFLDKSKAETEEANKFIEGIVKDAEIINQSWLEGSSRETKSLLGDIIAKTPDRAEASGFFESWLPEQDPDWLINNTSLPQRLNIVMQQDATAFMVSYLDNIGLAAVNTSLAGIHQMTVGNYVDAVWHGVQNGTLNPSYTPPNVNTPDSSNIANDTIYLAEHHLYGSSRLGIKTYDPLQYRVVYKGATGPGTQSIIQENTLGALLPWYDGGFADWIKKDKITTYNGSTFNLATDSFREVRTLGAKQYELTDHLGNVLVTALDKKTGYGDSLGGGLHYYRGYYANLSNVTDYYPFGMQMPGRFKSFSSFRIGYNGIEKDNEIYGLGNYLNFEARGLDTRIARWTARDPDFAKYASLSPYNAMNNNPIFLIDPSGKGANAFRRNNSVQVTATIYVYTHEKNINAEEVAQQIQTDINYQLNNPVILDGKGQVIENIKPTALNEGLSPMNVTFSVNVKAVSYDQAVELAKTNNAKMDYGVNFMELSSTKPSEVYDSRNSGVYNINDIFNRGSTTGTHEFGHMIGYYFAKAAQEALHRTVDNDFHAPAEEKNDIMWRGIPFVGKVNADVLLKNRRVSDNFFKRINGGKGFPVDGWTDGERMSIGFRPTNIVNPPKEVKKNE